MNEQLFKDVLAALLSAAEQKRFDARQDGEDDAGDMWSAVAGHLDNARQRMRS